MAVPTYTKTGNKATTAARLPKEVFAVENISHDLIKQAYAAYLANSRTNNARALKRGEVSGGGKKPWKQKGTGRARFGSIRVPIWRGGGITFGPTGDENYSHKLPTGQKRAALRQALTVKNNNISVIEKFEVKGKTTDAVKLLQKINANRNILLVVTDKTPEILRSTSNLQDVTVVSAKYLNVYNVINADTIVITSDALDIVNEWLGGKK